tara:strand:- start:5874 stop:6167 length:294 start_codon:yes stop_codon:yes gene_type:complete
MGPRILEEEMDSIVLNPGDIIIETSTRCVGFLVRRFRRIDIVDDDMYFWEVHWTDNSLVSEFRYLLQFANLEEQYLKTSIILDIIEWHSTSGGSLEL